MIYIARHAHVCLGDQYRAEFMAHMVSWVYDDDSYELNKNALLG